MWGPDKGSGSNLRQNCASTALSSADPAQTCLVSNPAFRVECFYRGKGVWCLSGFVPERVYCAVSGNVYYVVSGIPSPFFTAGGPITRHCSQFH